VFAGGLLLAALAGIWLARRMVVPIRVLTAGAVRIGGGDLDHRIEIHSRDEVQTLADSFNDMGARLKESYATLEHKSRQLEVASQHKSQFLANMSHELRTPLNAILGYNELLQDGLYGELPPKTKDVLDRVEKNGKHLLGLINDVLDLSKIEAGQLVLGIEGYSMREIDSSNIKEKGGTGLGLAIAKRIVELHRGRMWVVSEVGRGSIFHFEVPVWADKDRGTA